jgi:hypothetical protein
MGNKIVSGGYSMNPSPEELALILPWCNGAVASGTSYPLGETFTSRYVNEYRNPDIFEYSGVYVNSYTISGSEGNPLSLALDLIGTDVTYTAGGSFPSLTIGETTPFMFMDSSGATTLGGNAIKPKSFSLTVSNGMVAEYNNSYTPTSIFATDRTVAWQFVFPWDATHKFVVGDNGALAISMVFTVGNYSLTLASTYMRPDRPEPTITGRGDSAITVQGLARASGATAELATTLDSTP